MNKTILERAERVTRETIAPRASQYDVAGANPIESWRALWREGLLAGTVPTAHGGLGLDMLTYIALIRAVARGCANTGMTLHMHSTVMRFIDALRLNVVPIESLYWTTSGQVVIMTLLGGAGTFFGPFVGAATFLILADRLSLVIEAWPIVIGVIFMAFVLFLPRGIWGTLTTPGVHR